MVPAVGAVLLTTLLTGGTGPAAQAPGPPDRDTMTRVATAGQAPATVCRITDRRLTELSGLVRAGAGYVVVNDGADEAAARRIFFLDRRCSVTRTVAYPSLPRDTEDLARGPDGTLWVGDIGDNSGSRTTIGLWRLAPGARRPTLFRLSYPDGPHDAEALLIGADGVPVVVTKDPVTAGLYVPAGPLRTGGTTALRRAGEFTIPMSGTSNPFGFPGRLVVTGGGTSPDGRRAVLRTYADAYVFDAPDGDLVRAISGRTPTVTALPDEPQGEAVEFSQDGSALLTVSEVTEQSAGGAALLRYPLPAAPASEPSPAVSSPTARATATPSATVARAGGVPAGALAAGGVLLVTGAVLGILLARRGRSARNR